MNNKLPAQVGITFFIAAARRHEKVLAQHLSLQIQRNFSNFMKEKRFLVCFTDCFMSLRFSTFL